MLAEIASMSTAGDCPVFYDFEASCLGGLPIEVGWAFVEPSSREIHSEAHLIKPPPHWDMRPVWDPDAEKLHGISLRQLVRDGRSPQEIAGRMNQVLGGRELFADSPVDDERWLKLFFDEAAIERRFSLGRVKADLLTAQLATAQGWDGARYEEMKAEAGRVSPKRHRAEPDARYWAVLWGMISGQLRPDGG
jgi:hypothetical protein